MEAAEGERVMDLDEQVARILWQHFATEGTYDEDRHDDREKYLAVAREVIALVRPVQIIRGAAALGEFHVLRP